MNKFERPQHTGNPKEKSLGELLNDNDEQEGEIISQFREVRARIDAGDRGGAELIRNWAQHDVDTFSERKDIPETNVIALQQEAEALYKELNPD